MDKFINKILVYLLKQTRTIKNKIKTHNQSKNPDYIKCKKCNRLYNHKERSYIRAMDKKGEMELGGYSDCIFCKKINYKEY